MFQDMASKSLGTLEFTGSSSFETLAADLPGFHLRHNGYPPYYLELLGATIMTMLRPSSFGFLSMTASPAVLQPFY